MFVLNHWAHKTQYPNIFYQLSYKPCNYELRSLRCKLFWNAVQTLANPFRTKCSRSCSRCSTFPCSGPFADHRRFGAQSLLQAMANKFHWTYSFDYCERTRLIFNAVHNLCLRSNCSSRNRLRTDTSVFGTTETFWLFFEMLWPTLCIIVKRSFIDSVVAWIPLIYDMISVLHLLLIAFYLFKPLQSALSKSLHEMNALAVVIFTLKAN